MTDEYIITIRVVARDRAAAKGAQDAATSAIETYADGSFVAQSDVEMIG